MSRTQAPPPESLREVLGEVFGAPAYRWDFPADPFGWLRSLWRDVGAWLDALRADHPVAHGALIVGLTLVLVAILTHLGYVVWRALRSPTSAASPASGPPGPVRDARWYLDEARRLVADGRYADALSHRFLALVLELDARRIVTFHPAKTPAEYAREAEFTGEAQAMFGDLVAALYRHLFGGVPCRLEDLERFDHRAAELGAARAAS